jgi:hypothetical protein
MAQPCKELKELRLKCRTEKRRKLLETNPLKLVEILVGDFTRLSNINAREKAHQELEFAREIARDLLTQQQRDSMPAHVRYVIQHGRVARFKTPKGNKDRDYHLALFTSILLSSPRRRSG